MILLPTLNRTDLLKRFLDSVKETAPESYGMILVDGDDWAQRKNQYAEISLPTLLVSM